ncbi:MAG: hypothetical protein QM774_12445 [Gordonia sp. (in: high G+C Gram-positive bacteria)]|uniref:hypothetical protein n=1 Tax=Gordonia sp. (in: high G+C Gram-positive bacteria) TaxID=84139 RepID=UPI0039E486C6
MGSLGRLPISKLLLSLLMGALVLAGAVACAGDKDAGRGGVPLPKDFPSQQVPLIDGAVLSADGSSPTWSVTVQAQGADGNAYQNAVKALTDAGYTESSRTENPQEHSVLLYKEDDRKTYWVNVGVSATAAAATTSIIYSVNML